MIYSLASNMWVQATAFLALFFAVYWVAWVPKGRSTRYDEDL